MKYSVFVFSCTVLLFSCIGKKTKNFLVTENLKGKVKVITESFFPLEERDGKLQKGTMWFKTCYSIDENGNKKEWTEYNADGTLRWKAISKYIYKSMETECTGYKQSGEVDWKSVYKYDNKGNKIEEEEFNATGNKNFKIVYTYNDKGVKTERAFYTGDAALYSKSTYTFDENGNQKEEDVYDQAGTLKTKNISKYENFDKMGNWLLQTQYANDNIAMISERTIEYYQ